MRIDTHHLRRVASDIDSNGVAANEHAIADVVDDARAAGACPVLLSVLSDRTEPEVARARAFGMVSTVIAAAHAADGALPTTHDMAGAPPALAAVAS